VIDSAFVGMRKPDAEIYELTLERLGNPPPAECLFIDDIEANIKAARSLGIQAVHFRHQAQAAEEIRAALAS
ncbi:MAG: HAD-IA family hydrolase, partial [Solirubrobacterales bacterium]